MNETGRMAFATLYPQFYNLVKEYPDFKVDAPLAKNEIDAIEKKLEINLDSYLRNFFMACSGMKMNGLSIKANELGPIVMPDSEALVIGEFYLYHPGDRLLMLPEDSSIYYLEQRNGAITKMARNLDEFFNRVLPKCL